MQFANQQNMGKNTKQKHKSTKRDFFQKKSCVIKSTVCHKLKSKKVQSKIINLTNKIV